MTCSRNCDCLLLLPIPACKLQNLHAPLLSAVASTHISLSTFPIPGQDFKRNPGSLQSGVNRLLIFFLFFFLNLARVNVLSLQRRRQCLEIIRKCCQDIMGFQHITYTSLCH